MSICPQSEAPRQVVPCPRVLRYPALLAVLLLLCKWGASVPAGQSTVAGLNAEPDQVDFGITDKPGVFESTFRLTNSRVDTIRIERIVALCGCVTTHDEKKELAPGEFTDIAVEWKPSMHLGKNEASVTLVLKSPPGAVKVPLAVEYKPLFVMDPEKAEFRYVYSLSNPKFERQICKIHIADYTASETLRLRHKSSSNPWTLCDIVETRVNEKNHFFTVLVSFTYNVTPRSIDDTVVLSTNIEKCPEIVIPLTGAVLPDIKVDPEPVVYGPGWKGQIAFRELSLKCPKSLSLKVETDEDTDVIPEALGDGVWNFRTRRILSGGNQRFSIRLKLGAPIFSDYDVPCMELGVFRKPKDESIKPPTYDMVEIPGGKFRRGFGKQDREDQLPVHEAEISPFRISRTAVSNREFRMFCDATGNPYPPEPILPFTTMERYFDTYPDHPVVMVTWDEARRYAEWCAKRLPTEAEMEFLLGNGSDNSLHPWGDEWKVDMLNALGTEDGHEFTAPVRSFPHGRWRLFSIMGNVYTWCEDNYLMDYYQDAPRKDPMCRHKFAERRSARGGCFHDGPLAVYAAYRYSCGRDERPRAVGIRLAADGNADWPAGDKRTDSVSEQAAP